MQTTPTRGLPYLTPTDKARDIPAHSKAIALELERLIDSGALAGAPGAQGLPGVNAVPADTAVATYLASGPQSAPAMREHTRTQTGIFNVMDYGAAGNGTADDTAAIQATCNAARGTFGGGGTVFFPALDFYMPGVVELGHNLTLEGTGATLIKKQAAGESAYAFFCTRSHGAKGYGTGGSHIRANGLRFKGNFGNDRTACAFALHHTRDFIATGCVFEEMHGTGHIVDLAGCEDVTIRDSRFIGASIVNSRAEAIQIDISASGALSVTDDPGSHSGLPTRNVTVDNCKFLPLVVGSTTYPAPVPMGSHSQWEGKWFEGIRFINNHVENPRMHTGTNPVGILHFSCVRGLTIRGNKFKGSGAGPGRVISVTQAIDGVPTGRDPNTAQTNAAFAAMMISENLNITGNEFEDFRSIDAASDVIYVDYSDGLDISGNTWRRCGNMFDLRFPRSCTANGNRFLEATGTLADQLINLNQARQISMQGNTIDATGATTIKELIYISNNSSAGLINHNVILGKGAAGINQVTGSTINTERNVYS